MLSNAEQSIELVSGEVFDFDQGDGELGEVLEAAIDDYTVGALGPYKGSSRGGKDRVLYNHFMQIDGYWYRFLNFGNKKHVFKNDRVSFEFKLAPNGIRSVVKRTMVAIDAKGNLVNRGSERISN